MIAIRTIVLTLADIIQIVFNLNLGIIGDIHLEIHDL